MKQNHETFEEARNSHEVQIASLKSDLDRAKVGSGLISLALC